MLLSTVAPGFWLQVHSLCRWQPLRTTIPPQKAKEKSFCALTSTCVRAWCGTHQPFFFIGSYTVRLSRTHTASWHVCPWLPAPAKSPQSSLLRHFFWSQRCMHTSISFFDNFRSSQRGHSLTGGVHTDWFWLRVKLNNISKQNDNWNGNKKFISCQPALWSNLHVNATSNWSLHNDIVTQYCYLSRTRCSVTSGVRNGCRLSGNVTAPFLDRWERFCTHITVFT